MHDRVQVLTLIPQNSLCERVLYALTHQAHANVFEFHTPHDPTVNLSQVVKSSHVILIPLHDIHSRPLLQQLTTLYDGVRDDMGGKNVIFVRPLRMKLDTSITDNEQKESLISDIKSFMRDVSQRAIQSDGRVVELQHELLMEELFEDPSKPSPRPHDAPSQDQESASQDHYVPKTIYVPSSTSLYPVCLSDVIRATGTLLSAMERYPKGQKTVFVLHGKEELHLKSIQDRWSEWLEVVKIDDDQQDCTVHDLQALESMSTTGKSDLHKLTGSDGVSFDSWLEGRLTQSVAEE